MTGCLSRCPPSWSRGSQPSRQLGLVVLMLVLAVVATACGGGGSQDQRSAAPQQEQAPTSGGGPGERGPTATGKIVGRVVDQSTGAPLSNVYIVVGYEGIQRVTKTGPDGRYDVPSVTAGEPAAILGFHEGNFRYHNSRYDANVVPRLTPGQTFQYDFAVLQLDDPAGQPQVSDPVLMPEAVRPGDTVEFGLTVRGGKGGLSDEVFAASPELGRLAWLRPVGDDRYRATLAIPPDTPPGEYPFAFFAASNECYDPALFPTRVLRVMA